MGEFASGNRESTYWKEESVYATLPTTSLINLKNCVVTPNVVRNFEEVNNDGNDSNLLNYEEGVEDVGLSIEYNPQTWRELVLAIGKATNTSVSTYYSHVFSQNTDKDIDSFSVQRVQYNTSANIIETYSGCKFNNFTISWNTSGGGAGKYVKCSGDIIASTYSVIASLGSAEASVPSETLIQSRYAALTINDVAIGECMSGNLVYDNKLSDSWYGNENRDEMNPTVVKFKGQVSINYDDTSIQTLFKSGSAISNCSVVFTRTATSDIATFPLTGMVITKNPSVTKIQDLNVMVIDFNCTMVLPTITDSRDDYIE